MIRKALVFALVMTFTMSIFLFSGIRNSSAMSVQPGAYHVYGRVVNQEDRPVKECNVMLIKRKISNAEGQPDDQDEPTVKIIEVTNEEIVAITKSEGNYSFVFEPLEGNNFWVVFVGEGYRTRSIEINKMMRGRFFQKPNTSPIKIDVVLERN